MIAVLQRVSRASVTVEGQIVGQIARGLCVLVAVHRDDTGADLAWMAEKLITSRVFPEGDRNFHLDLKQADAGLLLISNFTVAAATSLGRRPTLEPAADPETARVKFDELKTRIEAAGVAVQTGRFREHMHVSIENDGPITFILDSREAR